MEGSSTGERPTFAQAFSASEGTAAASPTATTAASEPSPAGATVQPTTAESTTTSAEGPIPYDRHKSILDGAYKERDGYKQQVEALAWAKDLDRRAIEEAHRIGRLYQTDRVGYLRNVIAESLADADLAPLIRSEAARVLAGARGQQPDAAIEPDIPVHDANGQLVNQTYSAERVQQIVQRAIAEAIGKEISPIKKTFAEQQAAAKAAEQRQQAEAQIDAIYTRVSKLPLFKEHDKEIAEAMTEFADAHPAEQVYLAWSKVVLPKLKASDQAEALVQLEKKAAAAQVNPNAAVVASTTRPTSLLDKSLTW